MNKIVKVLISADLLLFAGWGLIDPIFAIFLTENIKGGGVEVAGFAAAIYWITKSLLQPFIGKYLDRNHGEKDDLYFMFFGIILASFIPIGYIFARLPWHIYALQFLFGLGMACNIPAFSAIFTRHIDKHSEAFDWSMSSTAVGVGAGVSGAVGGWLASIFGFNIILIGVSILGLASAFLLLIIRGSVLPPDKKPRPVGIKRRAHNLPI